MEPNCCIIPLPTPRLDATGLIVYTPCGRPGDVTVAVRICGHLARPGFHRVCDRHQGRLAVRATVCPTCDQASSVRFYPYVG